MATHTTMAKYDHRSTRQVCASVSVSRFSCGMVEQIFDNAEVSSDNRLKIALPNSKQEHQMTKDPICDIDGIGMYA